MLLSGCESGHLVGIDGDGFQQNYSGIAPYIASFIATNNYS